MKQQATKSKPLPKAPAKPPPKPRVFGDYCFDFIKSCKHDFQRGDNCPLCKLAVQASRKYFEDEARRNQQAREQSLINRAQMRLGLLTNWARCQNSFYADLDSSPKHDIVLSKSLAEMLIKQSEDSITLDFAEIVKILSRKNRVFEVGYWAAVLIQSWVRRYSTQRYVRRLLLKRFEYVPATKWKEEFYVDGYKLHKWARYPQLIVKERPASPRTVDRRINADNKRRETRYQRFQIAWNRCNSEEIFRQEQLVVKLLKQFVIFRDLVAIAMHKLHISLPPAQRMANGSDSSTLFSPVWVSMSPPSSSARQIGISMALAILPPIGSASDRKKQEKDEFAMDDGSIDTSALEGITNAAPPSPGNTGSVRIAPINYNRALQQLEAKAWDCLKCNTPEDVMSKLVCEDIVPSIESVLNISQDDRVIFKGEMDFIAQVHVPPTPSHSQPSSSYATRNNSYNSFADTENNPYPSEVLPMCMELRPFTPEKKASGLFRLFFYEEEFIAASQVSPWAFYPEVLKHRDLIIASLKSFANLATTKALVKQYLTHVNVEYEKRKVVTPSTPSAGGRRSSVQQGGTRGADRRMSSVSKTKVAAVTAVSHHKINTFSNSHIPAVQSSFSPPQELIFENNAAQPEEQPDDFLIDWEQTDEKIVELNTKYKFLLKMGMFQQMVKRANNAIKKKNAKKPVKVVQSEEHNDEEHEHVEAQPAPEPQPEVMESIEEKTINFNSNALPYLNEVVDNSPQAEEQLRVMKLMQPHLLGEEIYHLLLGKTSVDKEEALKTKKGSALDSDSDNEYEEEDEQLTTYAKKLLAYSTRVQTDIAHRITVPMGVTEPNHHYQLMVIDVYVTLPKPDPKSNRKTSNFMASARPDPTSSSASVDSKKATPDFPVEIHQVAGMFPCHNDRPPPNLECGLFDWSYFHYMYNVRNGLVQTEPHKLGSTIGNRKLSSVSMVSSMSTTSGLSMTTTASKERMWTATNPTSGVCIHKTMLPTGREFQFQMLASPPSRDHLENELPKKVKVWLGMPLTKR